MRALARLVDYGRFGPRGGVLRSALAIDAALAGVEFAGTGSPAFGGVALVFLGAVVGTFH